MVDQENTESFDKLVIQIKFGAIKARLVSRVLRIAELVRRVIIDVDCSRNRLGGNQTQVIIKRGKKKPTF